MGLSFKNHINRDLRRLARQHQQATERVLLRVAAEMAKELEKNTPRDTNGLAENVVFAMDKQDDQQVLIGYDKEVAWRAHFVELGTIKQPPQGFIQKTHDENIQEIIKLLEKELRRELGL